MKLLCIFGSQIVLKCSYEFFHYVLVHYWFTASSVWSPGAGLELPRTSLSNSPAMCRFLLIHVFSALYSFFMTKPQLFAGCQLHNILFKSSAKVTWDQLNTVPCHHSGMCWQNKAWLKPWFVLCSLAITLPSLEKDIMLFYLNCIWLGYFWNSFIC